MITIKELKNLVDINIINGSENEKINEISFNRRKNYEGLFFIPLSIKEDRQKYILESVQLGAMGYMINKDYPQKDLIIKKSLEINPKLLIIEVENINDLIYKIAKIKREQNMHIPIIAVTGSVGKTSICEMIATILKQEKKVMSDNLNCNTKLLLSMLLMVDIEDYEIAVLEAGMGSKGVMLPISELLKPSIVVINNIGTAHIGKLESKENILKEKLELTKYMKDDKIVFLNEDDQLLKDVKLDDSYKIIKYSIKEAKQIEQKEDFITFKMKVYGKDTKFCLNSYGIFNVHNAICAIKIGELLNIKIDNIQKGIQKYKNVDRRFKVIKKNKSIIIDDTYNASFESMKAGLFTANNIKNCKRKIAVLGDMLELGNYSEKLHSDVGELFKNLNYDILLTQGKKAKFISDVAKKYMNEEKVIHFENRNDLKAYLLKTIKAQDLIYLKASKDMKFNELVEELLNEKING